MYLKNYIESGHPSKGEGCDFILEGKNRQAKSWIPSGAPKEKHWQQSCRNLDTMEEVSYNIFNLNNGTTFNNNYNNTHINHNTIIFQLTMEGAHEFSFLNYRSRGEKETGTSIMYPIPTPCFVAPHPMSPFNNR